MSFNIGKKLVNMENQNNTNDVGIWTELLNRFRKPWCSSFTSHFVIMVVLVGGMGIILSIFNFFLRGTSWWSIVENIVSYSLALAIPSSIPILQSTHKTNKKVSLIEITIGFCIIVPIAISIISYLFQLWAPPIICMLLSWCIWVIANCDNRDLNDQSFDEKIKNGIDKHGTGWN